jgi:hypothetical protein
MNCGKNNEGVIPIPPQHQKAGVSRGRILYEMLLLPSDKQIPISDTHKVFRNAIVPCFVGVDGVGGAMCTNEITVVTGGADSCSIQGHLGPEQRVCDLEVR